MDGARDGLHRLALGIGYLIGKRGVEIAFRFGILALDATLRL